MFKILREVWLSIGVEKVDTHKRVTVKVLLDSGIMEMLLQHKKWPDVIFQKFDNYVIYFS